jgi:hypothetical protein
MCILAPASLVDASVAWREIDARTVEARFTNAGHTIDAVLSFDRTGDLADFVSNDRYAYDGDSYRKIPWRTPVTDYRMHGDFRLAARGDACWREPEAEWTYARFEIEDIQYNIGARAPRRAGAPRVVTAWGH